VQFRFIAYAELESGVLDRTEAKTVILPHSAALSAEETDALRRFAARGGRVVGDAQAGRMDEHCHELRINPLAGILTDDPAFGPELNDGVRVFRFRSRLGLPGRYFGFTRDVDAKDASSRRTVTLECPAFVYDLRAKRALGCVKSFETELAPGAATFYAALPYEVKAFTVSAPAESSGTDAVFKLSLAVSTGKSGYHPVKVDVYDAAGKRLEAECGMTEITRGTGEWRLRPPQDAPHGPRRIVFTDFFTGRTCAVRDFALKTAPLTGTNEK
jgi:hypothetical protein